jgi:competence protein ComEA
MLKKILLILAMLCASISFAATDANKGTAAELDAVKGIGPSISSKIIEERKKGDFKDWNDLISRVKGIGDKNAAKFSGQGLTVNGEAYKADAAAAPAAAKATKASKKADAKASAPEASASAASAASAPKK